MKTILIRTSRNPDLPKSYAIFFQESDSVRTRIIARFTTKNGSVVDLGKIIQTYLYHNALPIESVKISNEQP